MPQVVEEITVAGSLDQAYQLAKDMESYPEFMENVVSIEVLERGEKSTVTSWETEVDGRKISWREKDLFNDAEHQIIYHQLEGDLKEFAGEWNLESTTEGTKITLTVNFEFGVAMLAPLLNPILKKKVRANSQSMLQGIKQQVEQETSVQYH
ncbi:type II toxin-antitoxin system RatA family toxin [Halanaerobaculum tunisiense]